MLCCSKVPSLGGIRKILPPLPVLQPNTNNQSFNHPARLKWYLPQEVRTIQPEDAVSSELKGRDLINFDHWTRQDIFTLLWIAVELKSGQIPGPIYNNVSATTFYEDIVTKAGLVKGIGSCGAVPSSVHVSHVPKNLNLELFARSLSSESDIIFVESSEWSNEDLAELATGSTTPVVNVKTKTSAPLLCLAECLTLFEHYGYIRRLKIAYLGPVDDPIACTYPQLLPKIGLHFRYCSDSQFNDDIWMKGVNFSNKSSFKTNLLQFETPAEAIHRAHVVVTRPEAGLKLVAKDMTEAELDWTFLHHDIHLGTSCKQLSRAKQSLVWKYLENIQWMTQAIIAATQGYKPTISLPGFQGKD